jgi:hypothetical protein
VYEVQPYVDAVEKVVALIDRLTDAGTRSSGSTSAAGSA